MVSEEGVDEEEVEEGVSAALGASLGETIVEGSRVHQP